MTKHFARQLVPHRIGRSTIMRYLLLIGIGTLGCLAVSLVAYPDGETTFHFDEGGAVTTVSTLMLAASASFAFVLYLLRGEIDRRTRLTWQVITAGLAFLAADEQVEFHERIGGVVEPIIKAGQYGLPETNDLIVIAYGLVAVPAFFMALPEIRRVRSSLYCLLLAAPFFAIHTGLDSIDIEEDPFWFIAEETAKLICVALILAAMLMLLVRAINDVFMGLRDLHPSIAGRSG